MKFSGRLQLEAEPREWLKTELDVSQGRLELVSGGELLGSWSTGQVRAERMEGDRFQLELGADRAVFAADDALAFSYEALPALAKKSVLAAATSLRGKLMKGITGTDRAALPAAEAGQPEPSPPAPELAEVRFEEEPLTSSIAAPPTHRLRDLIQEAVKNNAAAAAQGQSLHRAPAFQTPVAKDVPRDEEWNRVETEGPGESPPVRQPPTSPEPARAEMIDRVGALRPLFKVEAMAANDDHPLFPQTEPPPLESPVTTSPPREVVTAPVTELRARSEAAPSAGLRLALDALIDEVRKGEMSPMQIIAVTDLVRAVAEAIEDRNRA